jgi:cytochrome c556
MLENLGSVNHIGEALALEDYARVGSAAQDLKRRAAALKEVDLATLGLEVDRNDRFDAYLAQQEEAADGILSASRDKDSRGVLLGVQQLLQNACLSCHADFRRGRSALRQSVLFMTTFLSAWQEMNRGLAVDDYTLVSRGARELQAVSRVLSWDQVIDSAFATHEPAERKVFRGLLLKMAKHAAEIERAAEQQDALAILSNSRLMWEACIACHDRFRKP